MTFITRQTAALILVLASSGAAVAQGDARFCGSYAANMAGVGDMAVKRNPACLDYAKGVHGNYQSHFDWCMKTPAASVQGAETNIRRLVSLCTGNAPAPAPSRANAAPPAGAPQGVVQSKPAGTEEPFGMDIGPWKFTQDANKTCRGYFPGIGGSYIIGRLGKNGTHYVSVPGSGFPAGKYPESSINIGGREEMIDATNSGIRFVINTDNDQFGRIVQAKGYRWRAMDRGKLVTGTVTFDGAIAAAAARIRECTKANGGV